MPTLISPVSEEAAVFKIPADPHHPTFQHTQTIGFWKWLTSSKQERQEWQRRRNAAAQARVAQADARVARSQDARQQRLAAKRARKAAKRGGTYKMP